MNMDTIAIGLRFGPAKVTENIDMSAPRHKAGIPFRGIRSLLFAIGLLTGLPGTAVAQTGFCQGTIDFCDVENGHPKWYDNAQPPTYGCFTDVIHSGYTPPSAATVEFRPPEINVYQNMHSTTNAGGSNPWGDSPTKPQTCGLNFYGNAQLISNNHADMWITIVQPPGQTIPMLNSWGLTATVWFDNVSGAPNPHGNGGWNNSKGVGIVANYNPANKTGLFLALFDAGNTESLALVQFDSTPDGAANPRTNMVNPTVIASKALAVSSISSRGDGGSLINSLAYVVTLSIYTPADASQPTGFSLNAVASVFPAATPYDQSGNHYFCPDQPAPDQQCMVYHGPLPAGIIDTGAVGLGTLAPTSGAGIVDTYISKFTIAPGSDSD